MRGQENMTLVDDGRGRDVDNMGTRNMFALSSVARRWLETLGQDELDPHGSVRHDLLNARIPVISASCCHLLNVNVHMHYSKYSM